MRRWEHWLIILLVGVLVYFWITWPKPKVDERVHEFQQVIDDQQAIIDSLSKVLEIENIELAKHKEKADSAAAAFKQTISRQRKQLQENETIHDLPTPELDSIVRSLYGQGAI